MKTILLLAPNDFRSIPTLNRHIDALSDRYYVYGAGFSPPCKQITAFITISRKLAGKKSFLHKIKNKLYGTYLNYFGSHDKIFDYYFAINEITELQEIIPDLIIVQNVFLLPVAFEIAKPHTKIIFDSQEYHPGEYDENDKEGKLFRPLIHYILTKYLPLCSLMFTYGEEIQRQYKENFNKDSVLFTSASNYLPLEPGKVNPNHIKIIHHGIAMPIRKIEEMIQLVSLLNPHFTLDLMLMRSETPYYHELVTLAETNKRIRFRDPVPTEKIVETIHAYDIGLMMIPPVTLNYLYMCPNKFWEYIQARLCSAFYPYPIIKKITDQYQIGFTTDDFTIESMAEKLNSLDAEKIFQYKCNSHKHAYELSAEVQKKKLNKIVDELLS